ncbi:hypothetical protein SO802_023464 [Lithocarpus litseifolius]|uniref:Uncharacterized protein n=1 Tax=Lithocarpus litseifolius TaxID=425828 RepID=A0AAW2C7N8_9ROSI
MHNKKLSCLSRKNPPSPTSQWKTAENRDKGKAPIQDYPQFTRFTEQPYEMHEGTSSNPEAVSLKEYATVAHSSRNIVISLQETPTRILSSGNMVEDTLRYTLEENLAKDSYGINSNFPYPTKTILDLLHSAYILHNTDLFQRTLKTLKNHLQNLEERNDHITSLLSGKEEIHSKDKTVLMGTCFTRLSLKTQSSVRSSFANLPFEIQVRILGSKAMSESLDLWFRHLRVLITTRYCDPDDPDLDYTTNLNYTAENALTVSRWEAYFGSCLRVYERVKHPFPGLLINYNDLLEDEEEHNQMNPHWLSQMFEYGFVKLIRLTNHNQVSQLPSIIKDTVTRVSSLYVTLRCWSTLPEWEMHEWETVQPSKHLVLIGGYSHQGPWLEGNTFLSYRNPKALADCWRNFFSNEIRKVTKELWKNYHFVGSTGRISVFTGRPYYESIPLLPWISDCDPRQFVTPGMSSDSETLIYCSLCEKFTTFHEHPCNDDPPWESQEDDSKLPFQRIAEEVATSSQPTIKEEEEVVNISESEDEFEVFNRLSTPEISAEGSSHSPTSEALNRARVEASSALRKVENIYYPLAIWAPGSSASPDDVAPNVPSPIEEASSKDPPPSNSIEEVAEQASQLEKAKEVTKEVATVTTKSSDVPKDSSKKGVGT